MSEAVAAHIERTLTQRSGTPCQCPTCRHSRAESGIAANLAALSAASEEWAERENERDMSFAYLVGEVEGVLSSDFADPQTRLRLSEALRIALPRHSAGVAPNAKEAE